jgi:hypothetical protein
LRREFCRFGYLEGSIIQCGLVLVQMLWWNIDWVIPEGGILIQYGSMVPFLVRILFLVVNTWSFFVRVEE